MVHETTRQDTKSGHYYALARRPGGSWYKFNDTEITNEKLPSFLRGTICELYIFFLLGCYILVFEKVVRNEVGKKQNLEYLDKSKLPKAKPLASVPTTLIAPKLGESKKLVI